MTTKAALLFFAFAAAANVASDVIVLTQPVAMVEPVRGPR